jgi:hypothetical protein
MAASLEAELEAFIRWLALAPEQIRDYRRDPATFLAASPLSEAARAALTTAGVDAVLEELRTIAEGIYESPASWQQSSFNRDRTATGYGRKPAGDE